MTGWRRVLVLHAAALGDSVLLWPLLRAIAQGGAEATFAARPSHAALAARWLGVPRITPADADAPALIRLWSGQADTDPDRYDAVLTFLCDETTDAGRAWLAAAQSRWPGTQLITVGPPGSPSRAELWRLASVGALGNAQARPNPDGPIILHVGAGARAKRWPLDRFIALADAMPEHADAPVHLIAGEVESERFTPDERAAFTAHNGQILPDLNTLANKLANAALVIGNDSGPAHLAGQLGVPTLALFGPTDPTIWAPVGPHVRVLAPPAPRPIDTLSTEAVLDAATDALALSRFHRATGDRPIIIRLP